ncbi:formate dehydrogenase subunit gamma [Deferribacter thermophilus]|uniref:formate dehydrogenase subunit gamma n=1 Tax=Deferribacter thermophilus TaxID=53573 RepID=UPI003C1B2A44
MSKRIFLSLIMLVLITVYAYPYFYSYEKYDLKNIESYNTVLLTDSYKQISKEFTKDWKNYGKTFLVLQKNYVKKIYILILILIPLIFLLHYIIIGPKRFSHDGEKFLIFNVLNRLVHWITAAAFTILVISGLVMLFGKYFGGGSFVRFFRYLHAPAAFIFTPFAIVMFLMWVKDMIIAPGDIKWIIKFGGYLSKKLDNIMPVGKFNPGQKSWFWLATMGGMIMMFTGYFLYSFDTDVNNLRIYALIHNFLGMLLLIMFLVHLYMSLFAIKGSLKSMITGYKHEDELKYMHNRYYVKVKGGK